MLQVTRRWWLAGSLSAPFAVALSAQSLSVRLDQGNFLHISAPNLQFITGKPLERLKDGALVSFLGQLTVSTDANATVRARAIARFALSYDIWNERFSITRFSISKTEQPPRQASHQSVRAAESWCLESLAVDASPFPLDQPIWVRLEIRVEDGRDNTGVFGDPGINLTRLIELFSRPARSPQVWQREAGPVRPRDLRGSG